MVNELGQAKLIDFSIARPPGRARGSAGTRVYMAPEQEGGVLTEATDVWGIGGVLYEAATGSRANGESVRRLRRLALRVRRGCASSEPDPKARPSIAELAAALDAYA